MCNFDFVSLFLQFITLMYLSFFFFYLYTGYYSIYRTFICIAHFPFDYRRQKPMSVNWSLQKASCQVSAKFVQSAKSTDS